MRTITLQIYTVVSAIPEDASKEMLEMKASFTKLVISLPCVHFFGNMAHQLLNYWRKIDDKV